MNVKLIKARKWAQREFVPGSEPDVRTIKKWVEKGLLRGVICDGTTWIAEQESLNVVTDINRKVSAFIQESMR